jgi:VIT1/CCC1 family predicted Fe2+/Mn2+ transporter
VLRANDGLTSNLALVMAVAGAQLPAAAILITGLTGTRQLAFGLLAAVAFLLGRLFGTAVSG